jgi:hypothetical protein
MRSIVLLLASLLLASLLLAQPAAARDDSVTLDNGQAVNIRVDGDGAVALEGDGPAFLSDFDRAAIRMLLDHPDRAALNGPNALPFGAEDVGVQARAPAPDQVRILFTQIAGGTQTVLILENGYNQALVYRARITRRGAAQPTDVCLVMPGRRGYEHWPYAIDSIELDGFRLEFWEPSRGIRCE